MRRACRLVPGRGCRDPRQDRHHRVRHPHIRARPPTRTTPRAPPAGQQQRIGRGGGGRVRAAGVRDADCGFSVIRPAAYCGVVGFKPSFGTHQPARHEADVGVSLDTVGVIRPQRRGTVRCCSRASVAGHRSRPTADQPAPRAPRSALCWSHDAATSAGPETVALMDRAATARLARGRRQRDGAFELPGSLSSGLEPAHAVVMNAEIRPRRWGGS